MATNRFADIRAGSPTARTVNLSDRSAAQNLKFGRKATSNSPKLASTASAPGYASNLSASRNNYLSQQYYPQQNSAFSRGGLDNVSVASDFDATITSDIGVEPKYADYDNANYDDDEDMHSDEIEPPTTTRSSHSQSSFQHRLQHKQSQSPMIDQNAEPELQRQVPTPISGRFKTQPSQFENLAVRSFEDHASAHVEKGSRKRSRSGERNQPSTIFEERASQLDTLEDDDVVLPDAQILPERDDHEDNFETPSNSPRKNRHAQNPPSSQTVARAAKAHAAVERELPEYSDAVLKKMAYADLEKEPWEKAEDKKGFQLAKPLRDTNSLQDKLEHYTFKEELDAQVAFYDQLSLGEWEEAGDWFVDKFTELMNEMKKKRMEKKKIAKKYEEEISAREKLVRGKSDYLDREFRDMRVGGEGILKGKKV